MSADTGSQSTSADEVSPKTKRFSLTLPNDETQPNFDPKKFATTTQTSYDNQREIQDSDTDQSGTSHGSECISEDEEKEEVEHTSDLKTKSITLPDQSGFTKNQQKPKLRTVSRQDSRTGKKEEARDASHKNIKPGSKTIQHKPTLRTVSRQDSKTGKEEGVEDTENPNKFKSSAISQQLLNGAKYVVILAVVAGALFHWFGSSSDSSSDNNYSPSKVHTYDKDWRLKVDRNDVLSNHQQNIIRASLKPILDKSSSEEGVSTLLILSNDEENAAKIARCLLKLVNTDNDKATISTEIDLRSHHGGKLQLDSKLRSLLGPGGAIRAVLLRHIDDNSSDDAIEQARIAPPGP
ncbi:unnamed protein product, partial [Adineta steineri]